MENDLKGVVSRDRERRKAYGLLVGKFKGKAPLVGRTRCKWGR